MASTCSSSRRRCEVTDTHIPFRRPRRRSTPASLRRRSTSPVDQRATAHERRAGNVAGTRPANSIHPKAVSVGRKHGLRLGHVKPTDAADVLRGDDVIVVVCDNAYEQLDSAERTALHWSVPDPVRIGTDAAFEGAYQEIAVRVERLASATSPAHTGR